jgi:hypothetical protein
MSELVHGSVAAKPSYGTDVLTTYTAAETAKYIANSVVNIDKLVLSHRYCGHRLL